MFRRIPHTFRKRFIGHRSVETIKGCGFFGSHSDYAVSGSDCGRVFVYDKRSKVVVRELEGHQGNVNVVVGHPHLPMMATSGIDNVVRFAEFNSLGFWVVSLLCMCAVVVSSVCVQWLFRSSKRVRLTCLVCCLVVGQDLGTHHTQAVPNAHC